MRIYLGCHYENSERVFVLYRKYYQVRNSFLIERLSCTWAWGSIWRILKNEYILNKRTCSLLWIICLFYPLEIFFIACISKSSIVYFWVFLIFYSKRMFIIFFWLDFSWFFFGGDMPTLRFKLMFLPIFDLIKVFSSF